MSARLATFFTVLTFVLSSLAYPADNQAREGANGVGGGSTGVTGGIFGIIGGITNAAGKITEEITDAAGDIFEEITDAAGDIAEEVTGATGKINGAAGDIVGEITNQCNAGPFFCCDSLQSADSNTVIGLLGPLGLAAERISGAVGLSCVTGSVGNSCSRQPACCKGDILGSLLTGELVAGCTPINLNF